MPSFSYFPIIKTTDAELRAYLELADSVKNGLLPVFELTRSRRSKKNPHGDIRKRIKSLVAGAERRPFILDLTTEGTLQNAQIEEMLGAGGKGFSEWVSFIRELKEAELNPIPVVHFEPSLPDEMRAEVKGLRRHSTLMAFRVKIDEEAAELTRLVAREVGAENLIVILDGGFIKPD